MTENRFRKKVEWCLPGAGWRGEGELLSNGYRVFVLEDEKISGDGW